MQEEREAEHHLLYSRADVSEHSRNENCRANPKVPKQIGHMEGCCYTALRAGDGHGLKLERGVKSQTSVSHQKLRGGNKTRHFLWSGRHGCDY